MSRFNDLKFLRKLKVCKSWKYKQYDKYCLRQPKKCAFPVQSFLGNPVCHSIEINISLERVYQ